MKIKDSKIVLLYINDKLKIQTDISGECLSSYDVNYLDSNTREVTKTKQFETCQEQSKMLLFSQFTSYDSDSVCFL